MWLKWLGLVQFIPYEGKTDAFPKVSCEVKERSGQEAQSVLGLSSGSRFPISLHFLLPDWEQEHRSKSVISLINTNIIKSIVMKKVPPEIP